MRGYRAFLVGAGAAMLDRGGNAVDAAVALFDSNGDLVDISNVDRVTIQ